MAKGFLKAEQRQRLENFATGNTENSIRRRARVVLGYDAGRETGEIAAAVGLSTGRVRYWRRAFMEKGMDIFPGVIPVIPETTSPGRGEAGPELPAPVEASMNSAIKEPTGPEAISAPGGAVPIDELHARSRPGQRRAEHVRDLAVTLFDQTRQIHRLDNNARRLLAAAALLHDLTAEQDPKTYHKTGRDLILSRPLADFSREEQEMLAALIRYQRGKVKHRAISRVTALSPLLINEVLILVSLLRIALSLDDSQSQATQIQALQITPEVLHIVIRGPHAVADANAAQGNDRLWARVCHQTLQVVPVKKTEDVRQGVSMALPFPAPMKRAGLGSWDPMAEAGRKILRYFFAEMLRNEAGARLGKDIEALHDMRVATRRLRAAFEVFGEAFERSQIKPCIKGLRATGRALGPVRDLDVFMEKAQRYMASLPEADQQGLKPLLNAWQEERETARAQMIEYLDSDRYQQFKQQFNLFVQTPGAAARVNIAAHPVPYLVCQVAPVLIYDRLAAVRSYESILSSPSIDQLHQLRIAFKRLRYTVEYFREVLSGEAEAVIKEIKRLQDHLGDLNDANVACRILSGFLDHWEERQGHLPLTERQNPEPIVAYLAAKHAERHRLMTSFEAAWALFSRPDVRNNLAQAVAIL